MCWCVVQLTEIKIVSQLTKTNVHHHFNLINLTKLVESLSRVLPLLLCYSELVVGSRHVDKLLQSTSFYKFLEWSNYYSNISRNCWWIYFLGYTTEVIPFSCPLSTLNLYVKVHLLRERTISHLSIITYGWVKRWTQNQSFKIHLLRILVVVGVRFVGA